MDRKHEIDVELRSIKSTVGHAHAHINSYKLGPDKKFRSDKAKIVVDAILKTNFETFSYDPNTSSEVCKNIADEVKAKMKLMGYHRYKFVCQVTLFSENGQSTKIASRYLWDQATDNFVCSQYNGDKYTVVVSLAAVYYEWTL